MKNILTQEERNEWEQMLKDTLDNYDYLTQYIDTKENVDNQIIKIKKILETTND